MKILLGAMALLACSVLMAQGILSEYELMIQTVVGKNPFLYYFMYGCYCGFGGRGQPLDATDRCCFEHRCCYAALNKNCSPNSKYGFGYHDGNITCSEGTSCEMETCECDRVAALCMRDNLDSYDLSLLLYDNCNEEDVQC